MLLTCAGRPIFNSRRTPGRTSDKIDKWDGIIGARGAVRLGGDDKWYLPYYVDIGAGSGNWTWQGYVGVGYKWGGGGFLLAYRNLSYNMNGDQLIESLRLAGPALGFTLRW